MKLLKAIFQRELENLGYPEAVDIRMRIDGSIDDAMAFYGIFTEDNINQIFTRIYTGSVGAVPAVQRVEGLMRIGQLPAMMQYVNSTLGNMGIDLNIRSKEDEREFHLPTSMVLDGNYTKKTDDGLAPFGPLGNLWTDFLAELQEDMKEAAVMLSVMGHHIVKAGSNVKKVILERKTPRYIVRVYEHPDCDFLDGVDNADITIKAFPHLVNGTQRWLALSAEVISVKGGGLLGEGHRPGLIVDTLDKQYGGYLKEVVQDAITQTRQVIN